jgi:hypothetical protein
MSRRIVRWTKQHPDLGDVAVWVDVARLDSAWWRGDYLPFGGGVLDGLHYRYDRFRRWLLASKVPIHMTHVSLDDGYLSITDGRHRFAWLRDHGVVALPVTTRARHSAEQKD